MSSLFQKKDAQISKPVFVHNAYTRIYAVKLRFKGFCAVKSDYTTNGTKALYGLASAIRIDASAPIYFSSPAKYAYSANTRIYAICIKNKP